MTKEYVEGKASPDGLPKQAKVLLLVTQTSTNGLRLKLTLALALQPPSLIAVPLKVRDDIIGVLEVVNKLEGNFENDDLTIAETLAASASIAIR